MISIGPDMAGRRVIVPDWSLPTDLATVRSRLTINGVEVMTLDSCPPDEVWLASPHGIVKMKFTPC